MYQPLHLSSPLSDLPVGILDRPQNVGTLFLNAYLKHFLGPRTFGRTLNVGAGEASVTYQQRQFFACDEYHTLESVESNLPATYRCSATEMSPIPSDSYDWVISTAVLEHVDDCFKAAREQIRVTKPGGYIYCLIPFDQLLHPATYFGDYWRFTPQGLLKLFAGCTPIEVEAWGDNPTQPNGFAVLFQKGQLNTKPVRNYWFEFPNEEPFHIHVIRESFRYEIVLNELLVGPMELAQQLNEAWYQLGGNFEVVVPQAAVARRFKHQYARRIGKLVLKGAQSAWHPEN